MHMSRDIILEKRLSFSSIHLQASRMGGDYHILLWGGDRPHIGCTVLSVPRPSLTGDGSVSVTSSVLNVTGHKDEQICRFLAEEVAARKRAVVVCTGGFHYDGITPAPIREAVDGVKEMAAGLAI